MRHRLLDLDPATYRSHDLHASDADWLETNCATDMWIEILHAWGFDPVAGLAFTVGTDFDGEQWTMFTYPAEDLQYLYGIDVQELNVWRPLVDHLEEQVRLGHVVPVDVDAYHLPDTAGTTYRMARQKTTIGVQMIDRSARALGYFHNAGYAELDGDDFDAVLRTGRCQTEATDAMPPFAGVVRFDGEVPDRAALIVRTLDRLGVHLDRRPPDNPVGRLTKRMVEDLPDLASRGMDAYHRYAFGSCRHLGANGQLAAAFVDWLVVNDPSGPQSSLQSAATSFRAVSSGAKTAEFTLARAAAGRAVDLESVMGPLEDEWDRGISIVAHRYAREPRVPGVRSAGCVSSID